MAEIPDLDHHQRRINCCRVQSQSVHQYPLKAVHTGLRKSNLSIWTKELIVLLISSEIYYKTCKPVALFLDAWIFSKCARGWGCFSAAGGVQLNRVGVSLLASIKHHTHSNLKCKEAENRNQKVSYQECGDFSVWDARNSQICLTGNFKKKKKTALVDQIQTCFASWKEATT